MKLYLLYYDTDTGAREEWNTFYTPCEIFDDFTKRQARIDFLKNSVNKDGEHYGYEFHTVDTVLMTDKMMSKKP